MSCKLCKGKNKIIYTTKGYSFRVYGHSVFLKDLSYCPICSTTLGYKKEGSFKYEN